MSFRSIILDRKGFEMKFMRSRSHSQSRDTVIAHDGSLLVDGLKQSCWANMPPELLRDVLMRIEASEDTWPARKHVVACAGVCRSWREIMKEIVKSPQISSKLTFPISLKQVSLVSPLSYLFRQFMPCLDSCKIPLNSSSQLLACYCFFCYRLVAF